MKYESITICIAGIPVTITIDSPQLCEIINQRYNAYIISEPDNSFKMQCILEDDVHSFEGHEEIHCNQIENESFTFSRNDFRAIMTEYEAEVTLLASIYSFDAMLRITLTFIGLHRRTLFIHSAGIIHSGTAYLFPGPSGTGKTTICKYSPEQIILNDEICAVSLDESNDIFLWGTPFWGEMGTGPAILEPHILNTILFPVQDQEISTEKIEHTEALLKLLKTICNFSQYSIHTSKILALADIIVTQTVQFQLHFTKSAQLWNALSMSSDFEF